MLGALTKLLSLDVDAPHFGVNARGTTGLQDDQLEGEAQQSGSNDGCEGSASNASSSPQWLSYYAKIAPEEIRRWVNPEDGSGVISYQQLVENLNLFNIPVLPMKPFASSQDSGTRDPDQPSTAGTVGQDKRTPPEMSSGAAFEPESGGTRQGILYSSADLSCAGLKSLPGRSANGSADLRASAEDHDCPTAEGVNDLPASGHLESDAQLTTLHSNTSHNGTTLVPSGLDERGGDLRTSAMKRLPGTGDCQAQVERTAPDEGALRVPVSATHTTYIGPVREFTGPLSGIRDCGMTRPGPHSQVPPDYVKVLNSEVRISYDTEKHAHGLAQTSHVVSRTATGAGGPSEGDTLENGVPVEPGAAAISLIPEAPPYTQGYVHMQAVDKDCGASSRLPIKPPPIFLAPVLKTVPERRSLEGEMTLSTRCTEEVERKKTSARDAHTGGITYSLGQYIWTAEDAATGTAQKGEPEMDANVQRMCAGSVFPAVLQPECRSDDDRQVGTVEVKERADMRPQTAVDKIEDLGMPYVLELRREKIAYLRELSERTHEFVRDDFYAVKAAQNDGAIVKSNTGGSGGLRAARSAKKASVVYVESPMLKAEMTPEGLWKVFQGLSEDQKKQLATLEGCCADLSETEALLCFLHCRSVSAGGGVVGAFQDFFGKMKMNAYALRGGEGWALYPHAAQIKHSCQPNVTYRSIEGLLVFFALTDIAEGSPLTMSYIDQLYMPTQERRKRVLACKRIFCECPRCLDPIQPERTVLCPHCRSTKLCFISEDTIQHAASEGGNGAATEEKRADLLQADAEDASEGHLECPADTPTPDAKRMPGLENPTGDVPLEQSKQNEPRAATAHEKRVDSSCFNADLDADSADSTDVCSHGSPSSSFSEPGMILPMRDKLCILGTTIAPERAVAGGIKETDNARKWNLQAQILGGKGRRLRDKDVARSDGTGRLFVNSDVESSGACARSDTSLKDTGGGYSDDDTYSQGSSEMLCASFLDACTSADSNGNCSSSELSEEEQEQTAEQAAADKCAGDQRPRDHAKDWKCTNTVLEQGGNSAETKHDAHCVYEGEGRWSCAGCGRRFTDNDMPVALETYLTGYYVALRGRLGRPTPEAWNGECGQLIRTVEKVLGVEHWLYVAGHLMLAQLYLGMWMGGHVVDVILTQALRHAALVVSSASKPAFSAARNVDIVPLVSAVLRILLFNGRFHDYIEWIEKREALQFIREGIGTYDEIYIAFATAYLYVRKKIDEGSEPSLGPLHRFAHASQYTIALDAAYHERKEAEERERTARMLRAKAEEAEALHRTQTLREQQITDIKRNIAALKTANLPKRKRQAQDVTFTSPDSVVGQYLKKYAPPGAKISNTAAAFRQGLRRHLGQDEEFRRTFGDAALATKVACEQAKRVQRLATEGQYPTGLLPPGGCPDTGYLPLIMLADPLERSAQQPRLWRKSSKPAEREKDWEERLKQTVHGCTSDGTVAVEGHPARDSREHEDTKILQDARGGTAVTDEEKSFVYRIPGLSGTAPGEFVTISQINHTKDGRYPPIPFFRTFFYIDHEARNLPQRVGESEGAPLDIKVLGCGAEGVAALTKEELEDLAAARYNYLHTEAARFNEEVRTVLAFEMGRRAQEAAAALDSITSQDARKSVSRERVSPVSPLDVFQELNKAVRDVTMKDAFAVKSVEEYREDRCKPDDDAIGIITHRMKGGVGGERDVSAHRRNELQAVRSVDDQSLESGSSPATGQNVAAVQKEGERAPECPRGREWELQNPQPCPGGMQSRKTPLNNRKVGDKFACDYSADRTGAPKALVNVACARRFLKPLDFSRIPPPPPLPAWGGSHLIALHPQYKLARAAGPFAYQRLQIHPPNPLSFSSVTAMQNPVVAALPVAPM